MSARRADVVEIEAARLGGLKPLWRTLYEHQREIAPQLEPWVVPFEQAWETRRRMEAQWLAAEPRSFVLADAALTGYALVRVRSGAEFAASWRVSDPFAELATLVVAPEQRGRGIGSALMDAVEERLRGEGIADLTIGAIATNHDALRFYERRGAAPFVVELIQKLPT